MKKVIVASLVLGGAMLSSVVLSRVLTPTVSLSSQQGKLDLPSLIPERFGDWQADLGGAAAIVNPEVAASLNEIYSQTLSRTYVNGRGERIMLSIAYGDNQSRQLQVHRPEVCYSAQGFNVAELDKQVLQTGVGAIPVMQLVAQQGGRIEPITYWVLIGQKVVRGNIEQGVARLGYGLSGVIADGLLFRVSTISASKQDAYAIEQAFVSSLMESIPAAQRKRLIGHVGA
ncbi:exosortase-associated protein EpsI, B-type [Rugamonas sp. CCM 8940]|uniref:exosortase-associated protein EpsI, B-type n=1 Tax=Rugamonas sp. CCM 8940 TaxID=2765359 RepID=UPI0018F2E278|nr:exosortase-associated protein EpsI, B-type [Rugamonas sp. CCM 8940]MBJ7308726.1 EpsI family protein [Rugamonas sp. CCM 8940]